MSHPISQSQRLQYQLESLILELNHPLLYELQRVKAAPAEIKSKKWQWASLIFFSNPLNVGFLLCGGRPLLTETPDSASMKKSQQVLLYCDDKKKKWVVTDELFSDTFVNHLGL